MQTINLYNEFLDEWSKEWFEVISEHATTKKSYYNLISMNANLTWKIVQDNPNKHWNYDAMSENPNITWKIVKDNRKKLGTILN